MILNVNYYEREVIMSDQYLKEEVSKILEPFQRYTYEADEIHQANGDGGDAAHRTATFYILTTMLGINWFDLLTNHMPMYRDSMENNFEVSAGIYRRTRNPKHWGSNPNNFSRDQWSMLQLCFAVMGDKVRLKESAGKLALRGGFHQNVHIGTDASTTFPWGYKIPDFSHPSHLSVFIRGMNLSFMRPLLYVLDLTLVGDLYFRKGRGDADAMMALHLLYANQKYSTLISRWVMKKYLETDFMNQIRNNFGEGLDKNGIEPMIKLYELVFKRNGGDQNEL